MADRTPLKVADHNDIADDDPFAELTRIMGFDPRQPVKPQVPVQKAAPANQPAAGSDFDIDLEKELMGEFGAEESAAVAQPPEPAFETAASVALDDELAASLDQDFVFDDIADHHFGAPAQAAAEPQADAELQVEAESQFEAAFDDDFGQAVASSLEDVSPLDDDLPMDDELAASLDREFPGANEAVEAVDHNVVEAAAPVAEAAFDDDLEHSVSLSLEDELTLDGHGPAEDHAAPAVAAEYAAPVQAAADQAIPEEDFSGHFDEAMADVDTDFEAQAEAPAEAAQAEEPAEADGMPAVEALAEAAYAADDAEADLRAFEDEFEIDHAPVDEPVAAEAPAEAAYVTDANDDAPEFVAQEAFDDNFELDIDDAPTAEDQQPAAEAAAEEIAPIAPAVVAVEPPKPAAEERSLEDELNALLGAMSARPVPVAREAEPVRQPVIETPAPQQLADDLDWNLDGQEPASGEDAAPSADIDFDDDAFDAAFARGIGGDQEPSHPVASASPSQDWLRSAPPEPARSWSRVTPVAAAAQATFAAQPTASAAPVSAEPSYRQEPVVEEVPAYAEPEPAPQDQPQAYDEMPDVETIDVPERVVALADDLDIPELNFEEEKPAAPAFDDLDAEFAGLLNDMNAVDLAPAPARAAAYEDDSYGAGFKPGHDHGDARAYAAAKPAEMPAASAPVSQAAATGGFDIDDLPGSRPLAQADDFAVDELDYDPELDQEMAVPGLAEREAARPRGRGVLIAAVVGAVALAGGLGAFALSFGGKGGSEAPVIVKADNAPIKVKPENPGGTVVPNQDNKVYDAVVKGTKPAEPVQEKLVTNTEEPVDVKAKEPESRVVDLSPADAAPGMDDVGNAAATAMPGVDAQASAEAAPAPKSEDRIAQVLQEADKGTNPEVVAVAPRKVRTMMVKPDGSLVAREDPAPEAAPQVAAAEPADPAPQHVAPAAQAGAEQTGTVAPATDQASDQPTDQVASADQSDAAQPLKPAAPKPEAKAEAKTQTTHSQSADTPATVPVAPQRPSDQPVDVVGEVKPDQVASISPSAAAAGGGSWSMQIASQPTVESAQSTYQDLQRRYGSVLSGRTANIVKAEIAGKGTFYRVRVPAQSRNDAIALCTSYKAAGGNCFVSR